MNFLVYIRDYIRNNIILIVTLVIVNILLVLLGILSSMVLVNEAYENNIEKGISRSIDSVSNLDNIIYLGENIVNFVERDYRYIDNLSIIKNLLNETFSMINVKANYFHDLYVTYGSQVISVENGVYDYSNLNERVWYNRALNTDEVVITNPYKDATSREAIITISKKVKNKDTSVIGLDIKQDKLNTMLRSVKDQDGSILLGFILNKDGTFIGHTNESLIGKTVFDQTIAHQGIIAPYIIELLGEDSGIIDFDYKSSQYALIYKKTRSDWHVVYVVDKTHRCAGSGLYRNELAIIYILCGVLLDAIILIYYLKRQKAIRLQIRAEHAEKELIKYKEHLEVMIKLHAEKIESQSEKLKMLNASIIDNLADILEFRDLESGQHIKRIKNFTYVLASKVAECYPEYEINEEKINLLCNASALHDIGKIGIADSILLKQGKLTKEEFEEIKKHTIIGDDLAVRILENYDKELARFGHEICRYHHERYDGSGYPDGLKGDAIPIGAQIVAIADVYDALVQKRVYKEAFSHERAIEMINNEECGVFSPKLLLCLSLVKDEFHNIMQLYK